MQSTFVLVHHGTSSHPDRFNQPRAGRPGRGNSIHGLLRRNPQTEAPQPHSNAGSVVRQADQQRQTLTMTKNVLLRPRTPCPLEARSSSVNPPFGLRGAGTTKGCWQASPSWTFRRSGTRKTGGCGGSKFKGLG